MSQWSLERQGTKMATATVPKSNVDQLLLDSQEQVPSFSFVSNETDIIAFRLWQRANDLLVVADDCRCCKGEAQQCYAACR